MHHSFLLIYRSGMRLKERTQLQSGSGHRVSRTETARARLRLLPVSMWQVSPDYSKEGRRRRVDTHLARSRAPAIAHRASCPSSRPRPLLDLVANICPAVASKRIGFMTLGFETILPFLRPIEHLIMGHKEISMTVRYSHLAPPASTSSGRTLGSGFPRASDGQFNSHRAK
jgi:hypothetical protein